MKHNDINSITNANSSFTSCKYFVLLLICVCILCSCITQTIRSRQTPFDDLRAEEIKCIIIEKYPNTNVQSDHFTIVVDSVSRTYKTYDTIYSDVIKNEIIAVLKDSRQEFMKFGSHIGLILKTDSNDIYIGVMKNNVKTNRGTFICKNDLESLLLKLGN